jgi:hypothetical protein
MGLEGVLLVFSVWATIVGLLVIGLFLHVLLFSKGGR